MSLFRPRLIPVFLILPLFIYNSAQARSFKNAYISFEIQDNWKCKTEQSEWVCRSEDPQESKEAVIILTAKEASSFCAETSCSTISLGLILSS